MKDSDYDADRVTIGLLCLAGAVAAAIMNAPGNTGAKMAVGQDVPAIAFRVTR